MARDLFGLVGTTIDQRYRVEAVVGEGGFGVVYRGQHLAFNHAIAVKCLKVPPHFTPEAEALFLGKFLEEGRFLSRLSEHGSIVRVFDLNVTATPRVQSLPYLVLEWLEGQEMEAVLHDRRSAQLGPYSEKEALELLRPAIDAIALAHSQHIAHRDLKPANIFRARTVRGTVTKVLDFGIAKAMQEGETATQVSTKTSSGFSAFSPQYGAPEQFRAKRFGVTGPWTDVHALGLILSELTSGRPPLEGEEMADFYERGTTEPRPTPRRLGAHCSDAFEAICARALALDPRARFQDAGQLGQALDGLAAEVRPAQAVVHTVAVAPLPFAPQAGPAQLHGPTQHQARAQWEALPPGPNLEPGTGGESRTIFLLLAALVGCFLLALVVAWVLFLR